jgi:hypothetical protein
VYLSFRALALALCAFVSLGIALCGTARAEAEFCPARIDRMYPFEAPHDGLRSFEVSAESERIVSGNVIVQGEKNWYTFQFVNVNVLKNVMQFKSSTVKFDRALYYSQPLYIQLPAGERLQRWWVVDAATSGEKTFGWDARGDVACSPQPGGDTKVPPVTPVATALNPDTSLEVPPGAGDAILAPKRIEEPQGMTACATPFVAATVTRAVTPAYPADLYLDATVVSQVKIAITADGKIADAWIYVPTGFPQLDIAAMDAAKNSTYRGGVALCKPSPGYYLFTVTYQR